jgi:uncharacterized protein
MIVSSVLRDTKKFISEHVDDGVHNFLHSCAVLSHIQRMFLVCELKLNETTVEDVKLAAVLHDIDDRKLYPHSKNYENARSILAPYISADRISWIIRMIEIVSFSSNGNDDYGFSGKAEWLLYPRYADRLEAIGTIGIQRCFLYSQYTNRPLFLPETPRAKTEEELWAIATPARLAEYIKKKESKSFIDHFYDKLLHIGAPGTMGMCANKYVLMEMAARHAVMVEYVLVFGRTGEV